MGSRGKSLSASARRIIERAHNDVLSSSSEGAPDNCYKEALFDELRNAKVKFSEADTIFITRDQHGKITWLEEGNTLVGLTHIQENHASQFEKALGIKSSDIPNHIRVVIEKGVIVDSKPDKGGIRREYHYKGNYYTVIVTGSNGFIITAHPKRIESEEK